MSKYDDLDYIVDKVPIDMIDVPDRFDRTSAKDLKIQELAIDIQNNGMHTEIWLNQDSDNELTLISGHRRLLAHKELEKKEIKAKIFKVNQMDALYMVCSENSHRVAYDKFERIDSFIYILHKEYLNHFPSESTDLAPSRILNATRPCVRALRYREIGQDDGIKNFTKDQMMVLKMVVSVFNKSGLFSSYSNLHRMYSVAEMSPTLRAFCVSHAIAVSGMESLAAAELKFAEKKMPDINAKPQETIMKSICEQIAKLEKKQRDAIVKIINNHKKYIEQDYSKKTIVEDIRNDLTFVVEDFSSMIKTKMLSATNIKRIKRLIAQIEKETATLKNLKDETTIKGGNE